MYKFYINALYVGLTRAVQTVVLVEDNPAHPLLALLGAQVATSSSVQAAKATMEQWQREAQRLQAQGKLEQADAIRRDVLKQAAVPWTVFDVDHIESLWQRLAPGQSKLIQQWSDFAWLHDEWPIQAFVSLNMQQRPLPWRSYLEKRPQQRKVALERALGKGRAALLADTVRYGVDHRTQFGLTLLMLAAYTGDVALVEALLARGARLDLRDHMGRMAMHWALRGAWERTHQDPDVLGRIFDQVAVPSLSVEVDGRLVQIGRESGEYLLLHLVIARRGVRVTVYDEREDWLSAAWLADDVFARLPDVVAPENRRRGAYLSSVFSRACVGSAYVPARNLFVRRSRGRYDLNLNLRLGATDEQGNPVWLPFADVYAQAQLPQYRRVLMRFLQDP